MKIPLLKDASGFRIAAPLAGEVSAEASGRIEGYAATFGGEPDRHGDVITRGAFARTLREHRAQGTVPALLWAHQLEAPIGRWIELVEDDKGLRVVGQLNLASTAGREAFEHVQAGDATGLSIGFITPENGRRYLGGGVFALDNLDLVEVSITAVPANSRARITSAKSIASKAEAVEFLRGAGLSKAAAVRFAAGGFPALSRDDNDVEDDSLQKLAAQIAAATAKLEGFQ